MKNKYGQYFTPPLIADFMLSLTDVGTKAKVLEPASGSGVFLERLQTKGYKNITAYEIDNKISSKHDFVKNESFVSANISERFNLVIGNPPYIRWKNLESKLKEELTTNHLWNKYFNSLCDYSYLFILKSIELLEENGQLIFITPEYWLSTMHSISLRNYMVQNGFFSEIYHFKETPIFENATVSLIVFKYIKNKAIKKRELNIIKYETGKKLSLEILINLKNKKASDDINIFQAEQFKEDKPWLLANKKTIQELNALEEKCIKPRQTINLFTIETKNFSCIGDVCDIANGMVSGLDKAFQFFDSELNKKEKTKILKVIKANGMKPYLHDGTSDYIFLNDIQDETILKTDYPNFYRKLVQFKSQLKKRYNYNRGINYWEWVFLRNYKLFNLDIPRIFVPCKERISNKNYFRFAYVESGLFPTQDVTAIFKKKSTKESLYYILALLNNHRTFNWLKYNGVIKGNIIEFSKKPIASIPFRLIDWENNDEITLHDRITDLVKNYIDTKTDSFLLQVNEEIDKLFT